MTKPLSECVAVVTGASRGVGKGIALGLGEAGATVYVTGRSTAPGKIPGTVKETAEEVTALGGRGVAVLCNHGNDGEVKALFDLVKEREKRLDVLVNNAFAIPDGRLAGRFWELPISHWDEMHAVGLRSHYVAAVHAAPLLLLSQRGLLVNVSSFGAKVYAVNVAYGVGTAGVDLMTRDMAKDLMQAGVCVVSIWPGIVKTERLMIEPERLGYDPSGGESPRFSGRAVAALAADPKRMEKTGRALVVAELAEEYGFTDVDGSKPRSLRQRT